MPPIVYARGAMPPRLRARLETDFETAFGVELSDPEGWLRAEGPCVTGLANASFAPLGAPEMDLMPNLRIIAGFGVGYDMIDVAAARARGIVVTHTPGVLDSDVANLGLLLLLAASRDLIRADAHVRSGQWATSGPLPLTRTIEGATVGIVGLGRIGRRLAEKLGAFGCEIRYHGRRAQTDVPWTFEPDLMALARDARALILCLPGGPGTDGLIGAKVLDALGPEGILVNIARGSVVDEPALVAALAEGRLGAAGLDVFATEPQVTEALRRLPNVVLSPHMASATVETRTAMADLVADNLADFFATGRARTPVPECRDMV
ncbi:2-hydroxyacid dehydrogenase [Rhodosalinus halophilus]|uniref:2-hydroxyacid dehydrogenase n=1 Tax=Rhodosalinus halophilus TaxID=2259333 RepID=A0A365UDN0_9RHOB|nr:2-hydroxyacid dehydrogenase [Rhodosalinus halophilus]RBI86704.1 2-hydroxyacid dehydrogenase [Rhodosalinus halophilus]